MFDQVDLKDRLIIIKQSGLDDVIILDENYRHLMRESYSQEEQNQFKILHSVARERIKELKKEG